MRIKLSQTRLEGPITLMQPKAPLLQLQAVVAAQVILPILLLLLSNRKLLERPPPPILLRLRLPLRQRKLLQLKCRQPSRLPLLLRIQQPLPQLGTLESSE